MRQSDFRTAVPTNPDPKWPAGYIDVLRDAGAQEKTIRFYLGWVRRFFANHRGKRRRDLGRTEIEVYPLVGVNGATGVPSRPWAH